MLVRGTTSLASRPISPFTLQRSWATNNATTLHPHLKCREIVAMARVESYTLEAGFQAPEFELPEPLTGKTVKLTDYTVGAKATLIMFVCNHCPFVVHLKPAIVDLAKEYQPKGVAFVAISSNSVETHPQDGPEKMAEDAKSNGYTFPYLFDESQDVAKAYQAACTPEFLVFDRDLKLVYHGQFDDSRPSSKGGAAPITGRDIMAALDLTLAGRPVEGPWKPSIGCNVKWHPGNAPSWYHGGPFVVHLKSAIVALAKEYQPKGVAFVAISSNNAKMYPQDGPLKMAEEARSNCYTFPYLYDESQDVARMYNAVCTPEFMVLDKDLKLAYHGQFDDSRPGRPGMPITGRDIKAALDSVVVGRPVDEPWKPSVGCSIKWN